MLRRTLLGLAIVALAAAPGAFAKKTYSHQEHFEHYEGTPTCLQCHEDEAEAFFHSQHYQWRGATPQLVNAHGSSLGKMNMINDFCTNPAASWIGEVRNADGEVLASGCSKCHAGRGKLPTPEMSREQLENIDCLICHASGYRRGIYQNEDGDWEWRSILWKNREGLDSVSKRISLPTRTMCLRCHSASGGGSNYKRGDLEYTLASDADEDFDVHMAADGNDMHCVDCHAGSDHRVIGRGADLAATDSPSERLSCDNDACHDAEPHAKELLNRHAKRVACTVCHIPEFARDEPTDMARDWSNGHYSEEKGKHEPDIQLASNVVPTYAWYNGTTWAQLAGEKVGRDADGRVMMAVPQGGKDDPASRIHAFKVHRGKLPVLDDREWLLPVQVDEYYAHGDIDRAVKDAARLLYDIEDAQYSWTDTIRYMGIYHGVQPAAGALGCLDCHGPDGRLDWQTLGYEVDPLAACLQPSR